MHPYYPFSAIIGQERLKTALLLVAIDPRIGGVLIEGPRGTAKTTLARALADILPEGPGRFVNLPLGTTEERLVGTLNLEKVLADGTVEFSPGLLQAADQGILYVDEVNLLPDHLVDLLLDVCASGVNIVEREGISHQHPARILLIGTMNPEEGELRPQLLDRFGFTVTIEDYSNPEDRIEIMKRRLAFDEDPQAFCEAYARLQHELRERCWVARGLLPKIQVEHECLSYITTLSQQAGVEGIRADLVMLRAARSYAAWCGCTAVSKQDIDFVAEFALRHRRTKRPATQPPPRSQPADAFPALQQLAPDFDGWGEMPPRHVLSGLVRQLDFEVKKKA